MTFLLFLLLLRWIKERNKRECFMRYLTSSHFDLFPWINEFSQVNYIREFDFFFDFMGEKFSRHLINENIWKGKILNAFGRLLGQIKLTRTVTTARLICDPPVHCHANQRASKRQSVKGLNNVCRRKGPRENDSPSFQRTMGQSIWLPSFALWRTFQTRIEFMQNFNGEKKFLMVKVYYLILIQNLQNGPKQTTQIRRKKIKSLENFKWAL